MGATDLGTFTKDPYPPTAQVLKYTVGEINYGGRVTDDWDRRCVMNILEDFYNPAVLSSEHSYSASGIYHQIPPTCDLNVSPQEGASGAPGVPWNLDAKGHRRKEV